MVIQKVFLNEKNIKIIKQAYAFKGYASTFNVDTLNSVNSEVQLEDTKSAIKTN